ncbi:homoserine kinase type II [Sinosporangium album]|uniref:Homoserine kinase type II n=1 Tax=Sinosporangium album TaxID=504805 RepID=A0A1G8L2T5_9ACTN|nr:phosphotransferase [Sinosporangium album]SDI49948.1 homoserine kinase type II [Sinosporangium album]
MPEDVIVATPLEQNAVATVLADRYGLPVQDVARQPIGQVTINYRVTLADGRQVFVKRYPSEARLNDERGTIRLATAARRAGIPGAPVLANRSGEVIDTSSSLAVSVWDWMPGHVAAHLTPAQLATAGRTLGRLHAVFSGLTTESGLVIGGRHDAAHAWRHVDLPGMYATIDRLLDLIDQRERDGHADAFDSRARDTLIERRAMLTCIPALMADLPEQLTSQLIHGDYAPVNLLWTGDTLTAVLDYAPPVPFLAAYDLGRMAFYPHTVTGAPTWPDAADTFVAGYLTAHPAVPAADVRACGRIALLQLLTSLYGVKQHYLAPGLDQRALDEFWLLRHQAARTLLDHLDATDTLLADLTGT